jgi:alkanesulfonate monooxygenase SsuD/methylene tetrahydromethanopterin reductase-like flavin-dependent oxidoreductase (luciferase family)
VPPLDLARVAESRRHAEAVSGLHFSVWVGDSGEDARAHAERLHSALSDPDRSVYLACNVGQKTLEIVTGTAARQTLTDDECKLATQSMREVLAHGDVSEALVRGLVHLGSYAID